MNKIGGSATLITNETIHVLQYVDVCFSSYCFTLFCYNFVLI